MTFLKKLPRLLKKSLSKWSDDHAMRLAASLAYYTAFSLAPMLLAAIGIAGLVFGQEAASGQIYDQLRGALGSSVATAIQELVQAASKPSHGIVGTIVAFVLVLFAASGVFGELKDALNIIWKAQPKAGSGIFAWIKGRFFSIGVVLGICFLLLVSLVINAALSAAGTYGSSFFPVSPFVVQAVFTVVSFGFVTLLFALLFKFLPDTKVAWRDVWLGSVVTALLFILGKTGLEIYISKAAPQSGYGAAGALALVLVWVYYSAQIFFMGAEFTQVYATEHGSLASESVKAGAPDVAAAPAPIASLPRPDPVLTPDAAFQAGINKLPAMLGLEKGKKVKPLRLLGRLTGAAMVLAAAGLTQGKGKGKDASECLASTCNLTYQRAVQEFEIYLPLFGNDGRPVEDGRITGFKDELRQRFGGFTFFPQESEGEWETGGYRFRDRIVILRVLTGDAAALQWFRVWRKQVAKILGQEDLLITFREISKV